LVSMDLTMPSRSDDSQLEVKITLFNEVMLRRGVNTNLFNEVMQRRRSCVGPRPVTKWISISAGCSFRGLVTQSFDLD